MFGLDVDTLRNIRKTIAQFPHIEKVLIYGSRAKGNYKAGSDIDITLVAEDLTLKNSVYPLSTALDDLHLPYTFDISILDQLENPDFVDHILRIGKTFYQKENNVRKGWKETAIGDVCEILDRKRKPITKRNRIPGPHPYYGATGVVDYVDGYLFDEPLVLVGEDGAKWGAGENSAFAVNGKCWVNNHAHVLRPDRSILLDNWLIYYLNQSDLTPFITGLTVPKLNQAKLCGIPIPIPPLAEQKRIVAVLDEAFTAIATATANTKKNIANAKELFDSELNRVFQHPQPAENSVSDVTAEWRETTLGEVCTIRPHKREAKIKLNNEDEVSFVPMKNLGIRQKSLNTLQTKLLGEVYGSYTFFADDDVLLAKITPCFQNGKLGIARNLKNGIGFGSSEFFVFRCLNQIIPEYLYYCLSQQGFIDAGVNQMSGAVGQQRVPPEFIGNYPIPLPSLPEQKRIATFLDKLSAEKQTLVETYETKVRSLVELKQSLLHQAFTGALTAATNATEETKPLTPSSSPVEG